MSALGRIIGWVARFWLATLRITVIRHPALLAAEPVPWALAFWHGQQFALLRWPRRRRTVVLVSLSRDGELGAAAFEAVGLSVVRGSSSRGGAGGLRATVRCLRGGLDAAFAVDGPRGPTQVVRSERGAVGATLAAQLAGGMVVPMASACASFRRLSRSWDGFELPLPFSRVAVALGAPIAPIDASPSVLGAAIRRARVDAEAVLAR